jgi:putative ABC transport system permease protein
MLTDLRFSFRTLAKTPAFAVIAVLTLGVGIGTSTAMFSALRAVVLSPFHYPAAEQLVHVWSDADWPLSPADFIDLHEQSKSFSSFGAYQPTSVNLGGEQVQAVDAVAGTSDVLPAFGVRPALGRLFQPSDEETGAPPVVILSHGLWRQIFGGDPGAIGRKVRLNEDDFTVVGIMPAGFEFVSPWMRTSEPRLWVPLKFQQQKTERGSHFLLGIARLRAGTTVGAADAEMKLIGKRLTATYPDTNTRKPMLVRPLRYEMTAGVGEQVWLLFGAVALVLLVACGNVASMLLARGTRREGEFAVRVALGATRGEVVRLALAESLALALVGAALGVLLAWGAIHVLRAIAPVSGPRKAAMVLDLTTLGFAVAAAGLTALLAGLPPALAAMRTSLSGAVRSDARGAIGSRSRHRLLRLLIIAQVAVAFVLASGAVLFSAGYAKLIAANRSLDSEQVLSAEIALRGGRYEDDAAQVRLWDQLAARLQALPGVTKVGITSKLPLEGGSNTGGLVNDETYDPTIPRMSIERSSVTADYFAAMGIRLLKGRSLRPEDRRGDVRGVVVNQATVARAWPNKEPLGEIIRANEPDHPWYVVRVVGVVEDVNQQASNATVKPEMYTTPEGHWGRTIHVIVRSSLSPQVVAPMVRRELAALDDQLPVKQIRTMHQVLAKATESQRAVAALVNFFMATALGLVAVGLYGTLSYHVQHRTREIGVRMALGAAQGRIAGMVIGQGGRWVAAGLAVGLIGSLLLSSVLQSLIYRMDGLSAPPLIAAVAAVGLAGLAACWLPARRAARMDPCSALRSG